MSPIQQAEVDGNPTLVNSRRRLQATHLNVSGEVNGDCSRLDPPVDHLLRVLLAKDCYPALLRCLANS